jgi:hypothetical protein
LNELPRLRSFELAHGESLILPNLSETVEETVLPPSHNPIGMTLCPGRPSAARRRLIPNLS